MVDNKKVINGKARTIHTGKKGGKYYVSKGKKVYFGNRIRSRSTQSSSSNPRPRTRQRRSSPRISSPNRPISRGPGLMISLGRGLAGVASSAAQGTNNVLHFTSGALGRTFRNVPYVRAFGNATTMPVNGPRNQDGIGCEYMGEFREDCIRNYCIRDPQSRWCKETKNTGVEMTRNLFMRRLLDGPRSQLNNQRRRPNKKVGDVLVTTLQRTLRNRKLRKEQEEAARRFIAYYSSIPAELRGVYMDSTYGPLQPPPPMNYPQLLFGKKKAKRNTKKKAKQTRK